jgi:hypothetical protein
MKSALARQACVAVAWCAVTLVAAGCQLTPAPGLSVCPWPAGEQVQRVLDLAPLGSDRETVIERLNAAGVQGTFGENQSIYYCDIWQRDAERWHINVVLLFDEQGKLYATRPTTQGDVPGQPSAITDPSRDPFAADFNSAEGSSTR